MEERTFAHSLEAHDVCAPDGQLAGMAMDLMVKHALTFDDWRNIFYRTAVRDLRLQALGKMVQIAETFGHWLWIYQEAEARSAHKRLALQNLKLLAGHPVDVNWTKSADSKNAVSLRRWSRIFEVSPIDSEAQSFALIEMTMLMCRQKRRRAEKTDHSWQGI